MNRADGGPPQLKPLPMRASRRELDAWQPGAPWALDRYRSFILKQAASRGARRILLILSAQHCHGCTTLKAQLERCGDHLAQTLVIFAEGGDLRGQCFFGISLGGVELHAPGVPTSFVFHEVDDGFELVCAGLGPLDDSHSSKQLNDLMAGGGHRCREAAGARLRLNDPQGAREVDVAAIQGVWCLSSSKGEEG